MILGGFFDEKSIKLQCKIRTYFFNVFTSFMNECLMNAESPDPRSTREFSSKSCVAAFTSHNEIHLKMLNKNIKKSLQNQ